MKMTSADIMKELEGMSKKEREEKVGEVKDRIGNMVIDKEERMMDLIMIKTGIEIAENKEMWDEVPDKTKYMALENLVHLSSKYFSLYDVMINKGDK